MAKDRVKKQKSNKEQYLSKLDEQQLTMLHSAIGNFKREKYIVIICLLGALIFSFIYGTLENPREYTLSNIGNLFNVTYRIIFIIWSMFTGLVISISGIFIQRMENYYHKNEKNFIIIATLFLVLTALVPCLTEYPFMKIIHHITSVLFPFFLTLGYYPFAVKIAHENDNIGKDIHRWIRVIWGGGAVLFLVSKNAFFELWFICAFMMFEIYLVIVLYEERIIDECKELLEIDTISFE